MSTAINDADFLQSFLLFSNRDIDQLFLDKEFGNENFYHADFIPGLGSRERASDVYGNGRPAGER
jgi:hypothetical protein